MLSIRALEEEEYEWNEIRKQMEDDYSIHYLNDPARYETMRMWGMW